MNWTAIIEELQAAGLTEQDIAQRLTNMGTSVTQATINRIKRRRIRQPVYSLGNNLLALHQECCPPDKCRPKQAEVA